MWLQSSELLTALAFVSDFEDNFKLQNLILDSVVRRPRGTTLQDSSTLSYRPEETGGRQRDQNEDCTVVVFCIDVNLRRVSSTPPIGEGVTLWCRNTENKKRDNEWGRVLLTDE
ncbi:hypothetical protein TNCV_3850261 [Trichonephila clavipes]|nr:hypothetical protein TNCV_3850261 [Trichonephila clavipes]